MATVAGAAAAGLSSKVGMLKVGMEADVIVLQARTINTHPMINAPGTVVTMMDTSNVDTVIIGGTIKKRAGKLVGVDVEKLLTDVERAQERVLARIQASARRADPRDGLTPRPAIRRAWWGRAARRPAVPQRDAVTRVRYSPPLV